MATVGFKGLTLSSYTSWTYTYTRKPRCLKGNVSAGQQFA